MKVDILICTFRRPSLEETLNSLATQEGLANTTLGIIVADNDTSPSAQSLCNRMAENLPFKLTYIHAPEKNISIARNACLSVTDADFVAFLDDDETASSGWICELLKAIETSGADAVFGPSRAIYPADAPAWIKHQNYHSNIPVHRAGIVMTGHTCNAMLRWAHTPWRVLRFDQARGRSGGEDTDYFFKVRSFGAKFTSTDTAEVFEPVTQVRLTLGWLATRKFRMGQSYTSSQEGLFARLRLAMTALIKAGVCSVMTIAFLFEPNRRNFWALRFCLHIGVVAGCLSIPEPEIYGR